ncbi:hypothetical protein OS493_027502 [Desmophyllum pertusum]|uniref:Uncharacterized protein n=1 Tax=Desmophyllum pertusum TaxID=174260 RepID=A0A9W9YB29_9CNID|nr:hypothetical protein OS493_027502 [Desmophyllum pertusum]
MKRFVFILLANFLLVGNGRKLSNWANDEEHIPPDVGEIKERQVCVSNDDCGELGCCFEWTKQCFSKRSLKQSCSPQKSSCPCKPGLLCTLFHEADGQKFYKCQNPIPE